MPKAKNPDVKELLNQIEDILDWFESDEIDLEKALQKYQRGLDNINRLEKFLETAKVEVEKINKKFA